MKRCQDCRYCQHCDCKEPHTLCPYHQTHTVLSGHEESDAQDEKKLREESKKADAILKGKPLEKLLNDT